MIEIPEPPTIRACASCTSVLSWLWSPIRKGWICVVRVDDRTFELHGCRHAQDPATWRSIPTGDPPSGEYIEAKNKIASRRGHELDQVEFL